MKRLSLVKKFFALGLVLSLIPSGSLHAAAFSENDALKELEAYLDITAQKALDEEAKKGTIYYSQIHFERGPSEEEVRSAVDILNNQNTNTYHSTNTGKLVGTYVATISTGGFIYFGFIKGRKVIKPAHEIPSDSPSPAVDSPAPVGDAISPVASQPSASPFQESEVRIAAYKKLIEENATDPKFTKFYTARIADEIASQQNMIRSVASEAIVAKVSRIAKYAVARGVNIPTACENLGVSDELLTDSLAGAKYTVGTTSNGVKESINVTFRVPTRTTPGRKVSMSLEEFRQALKNFAENPEAIPASKHPPLADYLKHLSELAIQKNEIQAGRLMPVQTPVEVAEPMLNAIDKGLVAQAATIHTRGTQGSLGALSRVEGSVVATAAEEQADLEAALLQGAESGPVRNGYILPSFGKTAAGVVIGLVVLGGLPPLLAKAFYGAPPPPARPIEALNKINKQLSPWTNEGKPNPEYFTSGLIAGLKKYHDENEIERKVAIRADMAFEQSCGTEQTPCPMTIGIDPKLLEDVINLRQETRGGK